MRKLIFAALLVLAAWPALGQKLPEPAYGALKLVPSGVPSLINAKSPFNPQPDGVWMTPSGAYVDFCSVGDCVDGPHLLAQIALNVRTKKDASAQEVGWHLNFDANTGVVSNWTPNTAFTVGQQIANQGTTCTVSVGGGSIQTVYGCIYEVTQAGTSGHSDGPSGNGPTVTDGTVKYNFIGAGANNGKSAMGFAATFNAGAGAGWGFVFNVSTGLGYKGPIYAEEKDCNNGSGNSFAGAVPFWICTFYGGGGLSTFPKFAYQYFGDGSIKSGNPNPYGAYNGLFFSGQPGDVGSVVKDADIASADNADRVIHALAGRNHAVGFLVDDSNSAAVLKVTGTHGIGIDLSGGNYGLAMALPSGQFIAFNGTGANYLGYNPGTAALQYGLSTDGSAPLLTVSNSGNLAVSGGVRANSLTVGSIREAAAFSPPSATAPCAVGQHAWDANWEYRCVATNTWKRAALSSW